MYSRLEPTSGMRCWWCWAAESRGVWKREIMCVCCSFGCCSQANWLSPSVKVVSYYRSLVSLLSCDLDATCSSMYMYHSRQYKRVCVYVCALKCIALYKVLIEDCLQCVVFFFVLLWQRAWLQPWWAVSSVYVWWMDGHRGGQSGSANTPSYRLLEVDVSHRFSATGLMLVRSKSAATNNKKIVCRARQ